MIIRAIQNKMNFIFNFTVFELSKAASYKFHDQP